MKKISWLCIVCLLFVSVAVFGAWTPIGATSVAEEELRYDNAPVVSKLATETVYYTERELTYVTTDGNAPLYHSAGEKANSCGAIAGAEIVAFYDKYFPNLIEGWDSYYPTTGRYRAQTPAYVIPLMQELYDLMQINVKGHGVSEAEFKSGLTQYFNNRGNSLGYQSIKSGSGISLDDCISAIDNNKVIVLFTTAGDLYNVIVGDSMDGYTTFSITSNHIMMAYGYVIINYYNSNGLFRTEKMLCVATGYPELSSAQYRINSSNFVNGYILNVY